MTAPPPQRRHRSKQDVATPPEFLCAVERDFAVREWTIDLAAHAGNAICPRWFGHGGEHEDALAVIWPDRGDCWLNPEFADIAPWVARCAAVAPKREGRIFVLVPASVGTDWYRQHVDGVAHVVALSPRLTFVNHTHPYPKDLALLIYGPVRGGFSTWRWKP